MMSQGKTCSEKPALPIPALFRSLSSDACTAEVHSVALQNCVMRLKSRMGDEAVSVVPKYSTKYSLEKQMLLFTNP